MIFSSSLTVRLMCILVIGVGFFTHFASAEREDNISNFKYKTVLPDSSGSGVTTQPSVVAQTPPAADDEYVRLVDSSLANGINFNKSFKADFNGDGVVDRVACSNSDYSIKIFDGKKLSNVLYSWSGPATNTLVTNPAKPTIISKRIYTSCEAVEIVAGRPSVIVSAAFAHPTDGVRIQSPQFVIQNLGKDSAGALKMAPRMVKTADGTTYQAAARSVKCTQYPAVLVQAGNQPGALCFYAGYDQSLPNGQYGDKVALLKLEEVNGVILAKDLTSSSGLPWKGVGGTLMSSFRTYKNSSGTGKYDGLSMMGAAWLDYDKNGLPDLITVGQHSSIRSSQMVHNSSKPEGIAFTTTNILTASKSSMTEFLNVSAVNEQDARIMLPCLYFSGEVANVAALKSYDVPDHLRCYEAGTWVVRMLPGKVYSSGQQGASVRMGAQGKILILAPSFITAVSGALSPATPATNLFEIAPPVTCQVKLDSQLSTADTNQVLKTESQTVVVTKGSSPRIGGWVDCKTKSYNAYFTGSTLTSGTSNISQLGWWTEKNFLAHQTAFEAILYRNVDSFLAAPGTVKTVSLKNACANTITKITATVQSCAASPVAMEIPVMPSEDGQMAAVAVSGSGTDSGLLTQLQTLLSYLSRLLR